MPHPAAHYSYGQLEGLWISAGGPKRMAPLMAAIAMAESRGYAQARNPSGATGLWQILGKPFPGDATDPETNARMAVAKWHEQGLKAWTTYTNDDYKQWFKRGVPPVPPGGDGGATAHVGVPYRDPFRGFRNFQAERIDMGVDYGGSGPVYALGEGRIVSARTGTGWGPPAGASPGGWIAERIAKGPLRGRYVYVAEGVVPSVRPGQHVTAGTVIGHATGGGIETGLAAPPGSGDALAAQLGEIPRSGDPGAHPTAAGVAYANVLRAAGAKTVPIPKTGAGAGSGLPPWLVGLFAGLDKGTGGTGQFGAGTAGAIGQLAGSVQGITDWLNGLGAAVDWLLNPANWVRIIAGVGGGLLAVSGIFVLSHVGGTVPGTGISARPAALPIGIGMVGLGAILLFVAFHNLPGEPANVTELLGSLRQDSQQAVAA